MGHQASQRTPSIWEAMACSCVAGAVFFLAANTTNLENPRLALYDGIMCDSDRECEEATGYPYEVAVFHKRPPKYPVLVGIDCEGASAPIYAFEENHLPDCRSIFPMDWDWRDRLQKGNSSVMINRL